MTTHPSSLASPPLVARPARSGRALKVGVLTPHNALSRTSFSGTPFRAAAALAAQPGVDLRLPGAQHRVPGRLDRFRRAQAPAPEVCVPALAACDVVISLVASELLDHLPRDGMPPLIHVTDATPAFLRDIYGWDVPGAAFDIEARVLCRATAIYSSAMMAERARAEFPGMVPPHVLPFGLNFDAAPALCPAKPPLQPLNLLFVGADWQRKGGDLAVAALKAVQDRGIAATLSVLGHLPDDLPRQRGLVPIGFLDKNKPHERARLARLYRDAHLLLLPTRADCTPVVIAEAMIHGTPVIASDTGGIPEMIPPTTGRCLPLEATAADWADAICGLTQTPGTHALSSDAAHDWAWNRFSWDRWATEVIDLADSLCRARAERAA